MSYSVIIPSKSTANLKACLEAIRKNEPGARVIVVDDGLERRPEGVEYVAGVKPFVYARNINLGIAAAGGDDVILLNDDALLGTWSGFGLLAKFAAVHPAAGCVAPACDVTGQRLQFPIYRPAAGYRWVDTVPYICVYIPRRALERVGLLDERYAIDYGVEDRDHTTAMEKAGLKVAIVYDCFVNHSSLKSSFRGDPRRSISFAKNYGLYRQKWGIR